MNNKTQKRVKALHYAAAFCLLMASGGFTTSLVYAQSTPTESTSKGSISASSLNPSTTVATTDKTASADSESANTDTTPTSDTDTIPALVDDTAPVKDPLEKFNRGVFSFNDTVDAYILKPIATIYNKVLPKFLNQGINNIYNNISELPTIANDVLQLHIVQFMNDAWRLGINSTVGILGFFDVATKMKLPFYQNDFGLTLARWGYSNSTYLVLPFFGPNSPRDGIAIPVDYFAFSIYPYVDPQSARYELYGVGVINRRAQLLKFQSVLEEAALDRYVFIRNAYLQRRAYQIKQNKELGFWSSTSADDSTLTPVPNNQAVDTEATMPLAPDDTATSSTTATGDQTPASNKASTVSRNSIDSNKKLTANAKSTDPKVTVTANQQTQ